MCIRDRFCACDDVDGLVDANLLRRCLPAPSDTKSAVLVSGPPGLVRRLCGTTDKREPLGGLLREMGYGAQVARLD